MVKKKEAVLRKKTLAFRPPIVAVLGHVDHGKTTLLDAIRRTSVAASEAGGITQHIGAYQISFTPKPTTHNSQPTPRLITFIDTPGHVAFSKMRSRGAKVADLVVLVVSADEGVKAQTLESLKHIQSVKVPYLVALTKIDLPNKNLERVKKELGKHGVMVEGHGGDIVSVPVSGKTGKGVEDLLEMIIILAEMAELRGNLKNPFKGVIIESKLDSRKGLLATLLVQDGHLRVSEEIVIERRTAKVRAMFDENGRRVNLAGPSKPVEVLGFKEVPPVGSKVEKAGSQKAPRKSRRNVGTRGKLKGTEDTLVESGSTGPGARRYLAGQAEKTVSVPSGTSVPSVIEESETPGESEKKLEIILKADVAGTLEAITNSLPKEVKIIHSAVGKVNESDILLADTTRAQIVAFNVRVLAAAKKLAAIEKVKIATFQVIYELLDEIEKKVLRLLEPTIDEKILGRAEILEMFEIRKERIAGCQVVEGEIKKTDRLHLSRKGINIGDCRTKSMKTKKREIEKVKKGDEFGAILSPSLDFERGDMLISFRKVEEY